MEESGTKQGWRNQDQTAQIIVLCTYKLVQRVDHILNVLATHAHMCAHTYIIRYIIAISI